MALCIFLVLLGGVPRESAANQTSGVIQDSGVVRARVGESVTLRCFYLDNAVSFLSWYQQSLGGKLEVVSSRMKHDTKSTMSRTYKERFQVSAQNQDGNNHLTITDLRLSDSATYFCGNLEFIAIEFGQGVFLHVQASPSNIQPIVQQPALQPLRTGDSVNLSFTVYVESRCAGEQSSYWFRHDTAQATIMESIMECTSLSAEKPPGKYCTLNLAITSADPSDAGMYYCVLASCGEIVFGNGTRVKIIDGSDEVLPLVVYCTSVALAISTAVMLSLALILYKLKNKLCSVCKGAVSHPTCSAASDDATSRDEDTVTYAALSLNKISQRRRPEGSMKNYCVYSRIRSIKE